MTKQIRSPETIFRERGGVLRMSEALAAGLNRRNLYALRDAGTITQLSRGVYRLASLPELKAPDLVTIAARVPAGVVCLISALAYHELTTQIPHAVDYRAPPRCEKPRIDYPPVSVHWFSGPALHERDRDANGRRPKAARLQRREERRRCLQVSQQARPGCCARSAEDLARPPWRGD